MGRRAPGVSDSLRLLAIVLVFISTAR